MDEKRVRRKIVIVCGTRPNFIKVASLMRAFKKDGSFAVTLIHTGQHFDKDMYTNFFEDLGIPRPDYDLAVYMPGRVAFVRDVMLSFSFKLDDIKPDLVMVVGDVDSTMACAITAKQLQYPLAHVEAGLRSFDRTMPEEINRILVDSISDYFFVTEPSGVRNLRNEGVLDSKIFHVGNTMIDTLITNLPKTATLKMDPLVMLDLKKGKYCYVTLHRPCNVDNRVSLENFLGIVEDVAKMVPVVFSVHPRTNERLRTFDLFEWLKVLPNVQLLTPVDYLDSLQLMQHAMVLMTDSGGMQEESTFLGVPCITLRDNTERPITTTMGTSVLTGMDKATIVDHVKELRDNILSEEHKYSGSLLEDIERWDGHAGDRIVAILKKKLA